MLDRIKKGNVGWPFYYFKILRLEKILNNSASFSCLVLHESCCIMTFGPYWLANAMAMGWRILSSDRQCPIFKMCKAGTCWNLFHPKPSGNQRPSIISPLNPNIVPLAVYFNKEQIWIERWRERGPIASCSSTNHCTSGNLYCASWSLFPIVCIDKSRRIAAKWNFVDLRERYLSSGVVDIVFSKQYRLSHVSLRANFLQKETALVIWE